MCIDVDEGNDELWCVESVVDVVEEYLVVGYCVGF